MKQLVVLVGCGVFLSGLVGCQNAKRGVEVAVDGEFPEVMVGVWEAEVSRYNKWSIKFEPDGSISKIIHAVAGPVDIAEGGVHAEGPEDNTYYVFAMGPCEAEYTPGTRMLKVKIVVDYFIMKLPQGELEGRIEDYFEGPVSDDGRTWRVNSLSYGWLEGAAPPDVNMIEANPDKLTFFKLDVSQIIQEEQVQ